MEIAVNVTPVATSCQCQQYEATCPACKRKLPRLASFGTLRVDYIRCRCGAENVVRRPR